MAWIQIDNKIMDYDKYFKLALTLYITEAHAIGLMVCLWTWAIKYAPDGDITDFPALTIARAAGWIKDPDVFYAAINVPESPFIENVSGRMMLRDWEKIRVAGYKKDKGRLS